MRLPPGVTSTAVAAAYPSQVVTFTAESLGTMEAIRQMAAKMRAAYLVSLPAEERAKLQLTGLEGL